MKKAVFAAVAACALVIGMAGCSPQVDKSELSQLAEQAEAIDESAYTAESVVAMNSCLNDANDLLKNGSATQDQVDACATELESAIGALHAHEVTEWIDVVQATCSTDGFRKSVCSTCGKQVTESTEKLPHTEGEWEVTAGFAVSPSGTVTPGQRSLICSVCGEVIRTEPYTVELTSSQTNALRAAAQYFNVMPFSHDGLIEQLEFEGYSTEDASFAADNCGADWNRQAELKAQQYLDSMPFSHSGLVEQLVFEGFTQEQAEHGVASVGL